MKRYLNCETPTNTTEEAMAATNYITLRTGDKMPYVGLGTWKIPKNVTAEVVKTALSLNYKLLDCACDYGNEKEVGQGIQEALKAKIINDRSDIFITSKLWNTYHAKEHVRKACEKTLKDLSVDYLDLYLIHFPISLKYVDFETRYPPEWNHSENEGLIFADVPVRETWEAMEELVTAGLVKNIGISNFNCQNIMDLMKYAKIKPAVLQVELHPYLAQSQLIEYCQRPSVNIAVTAYSSFGGISYIPLNNSLATSTPSLLSQPAVLDIAKKHSKTPAQVLLRWAIERKIAVIPKSLDPARLKENADLFGFSLDDSDLLKLKALNTGLRFNDPADFANYPIYG